MNLSQSQTERIQTEQSVAESSWQGRLHLIFRTRERQTLLTRSEVQAPLKIQRPFFPEGPEVCHGVILHTAGGVVGGDRLLLDIELQPEAQVLLTTAAASKIYRTNGLEAQQQTQIRIAPGACLEWLPQESIVFDQAIYRQTTHIDLAPQAYWLGWELTRLGRTARGEQFLAGHWRSRTEVWQAGRPLWIDRQWVPGNEVVFHSPHGLAGCPVVGSFAFVGQTVEAELVQQIRDRWAHLMATTDWEPHPSRPAQIGVTRLQAGLVCRYRGHSTSLARQWFVAAWQLLRSQYLSRSVCLPRVWQL